MKPVLYAEHVQGQIDFCIRFDFYASHCNLSESAAECSAAIILSFIVAYFLPKYNILKQFFYTFFVLVNFKVKSPPHFLLFKLLDSATLINFLNQFIHLLSNGR